MGACGQRSKISWVRARSWHGFGARHREAEAAVAAYDRVAAGLYKAIRDCGSGRELVERGFEQDVRLAAGLDASPIAPVLQDQEFRGA